MNSESLFFKWSTAKKRVNTVAVAALLAPSLVCAEILLPMAPQSLVPGDFLSYPVMFNSLMDKRLQLRVESGPEGARLIVDSTGQVRIIWQSTSEMRPSVNIYVVARDVDTGQRLESKILVVKAAESMAEIEEPRAEVLEPKVEIEEPRAEIEEPSAEIQEPKAEIVVPKADTDVPKAEIDKPVAEAEVRETLVQDIETEGEWEWVFKLDPGTVELSAGGLPPGAMFMNDSEKGYMLRWSPKLEQQGLYEVNLQAVDRFNRSKVTNTSMLLRVKPRVIPTNFEDPDTPSIMPLANQVVSAGRIISFKVDSTAEDGTKPVLLVDRIPRDASFDANSDGSRTFFWQTGDRDQGEHVFRFTAVNPREPDLRSFKDVLIVVGDPTRNKTAPVQ